MKLILILISLLLTQQEGGVGPGTSWQRYTVKDEEFSVTLPKLPELTTTQAARKSDRKLRFVRHLRTTFDNINFTIDSLENPEPRQSVEQLVDELTLISDYKYDPATKRHLTIDGFDGTEYSSVNQSFFVMVQFLATEKHLYRFLAMGPVAERPTMMEFFSSIKLGKAPDGIEVSEYTAQRIYPGRDVDVKARILKTPQPSYTKAARKNGIEGTVVLKAVFAKNGEVQNIRVVSGLPDGLTEQAIEAAKKITFTPAMKNGQPVSMWFQLEFNFSSP
jgi:TonB family protein